MMWGEEGKGKRKKGKGEKIPSLEIKDFGSSAREGQFLNFSTIHPFTLSTFSHSAERYNRNIIIPQIGEEGQEKLLQAKILVCGAGGLGSTVLANLASVGIGSIGIIDDDVLELSNLNRQYIHKFLNLGKVKTESAKDWIKEFNPEINVSTYQIRLDEHNYSDIVKDYDFIMDCFDSFKSKFLLNKIAVKTGKTLIHGGVTEFFGQVIKIIPHKTVCLNCILPEENAYVIKGVLSPAVTTIASIQSMEAVKIILNIGEGLENKLLSYNGLTMRFKTINLTKNPDCKLCSGKN
ncbi:MAG: HesA/MoeB/ThiF family protein [Candidatus Gastranaerophilales bacterium]|nr:HesA/MoeB/ThiF family protein [Candidatus Gastranaerophilales bacterium]